MQLPNPAHCVASLRMCFPTSQHTPTAIPTCPRARPRTTPTGESRGFAFINFTHRDDAQRAINKLNGFGYDNLILKVCVARFACFAGFGVPGGSMLQGAGWRLGWCRRGAAGGGAWGRVPAWALG